jgi:capsule polysaccharide export protein KpsE/RkpR
MVEAAARLQGELIAAESEKKGLEAIYASGNPRVRAIDARVTELRKQLEKLSSGGTDDASAPAETFYPSIRQLPLLGVKYADLYRRTKIQETVYETLTQEYELAKVQEAKETPTVKVLDPASFPERRSFPPRTSITLLGASFGLAAGIFWLIVHDRWTRTDAMDPRKMFAEEILDSVQRQMPWAPPNGSRGHAIAHGIWIRFAGKVTPPADSGKPQ